MWPVMNSWDRRLDPFSEISRLHREMNRLFDSHERRAADFPALNVYGNAEEVRVVAELPGIDPNQLNISVTGNTLTVEGERAAAERQEQEVVYRQERPTGRFVRTIRLPYEVEADQTKARYENGVLQMTLPRSEATKPRRITIQS